MKDEADEKELYKSKTPNHPGGMRSTTSESKFSGMGVK
jgi:hypothetical protein